MKAFEGIWLKSFSYGKSFKITNLTLSGDFLQFKTFQNELCPLSAPKYSLLWSCWISPFLYAFLRLERNSSMSTLSLFLNSQMRISLWMGQCLTKRAFVTENGWRESAYVSCIYSNSNITCDNVDQPPQRTGIELVYHRAFRGGWSSWWWTCRPSNCANANRYLLKSAGVEFNLKRVKVNPLLKKVRF